MGRLALWESSCVAGERGFRFEIICGIIDLSVTFGATFSLRLGHISALALSTPFTTEMPLRYSLRLGHARGEAYSCSEIFPKGKSKSRK